MLVFSLVLGALKIDLSTLPCPLIGHQLLCNLLIFLLRCTQGLVSLGAEVSLNPDLIPGILDPLLSYKNLLDSLHINNKGEPLKKKKKKKKTLSEAC